MQVVVINKKLSEMKNPIKLIAIVLLMFTVSTRTLAHGEHHHKGTVDTVKKTMAVSESANLEATSMGKIENFKFSTFHPLIVHFPIVLLIVAALLQAAGLFYSKNNWNIIILLLLSGGTLGAYLSGNYFHPHTEGLSMRASEVLKRHEFYALLTVCSSAVALVIKLLSVFLVENKRKLVEIIIAIVLLFSAVCVSFAGHWGAYLTHIEGVGLQGRYIESE